MNMKCINAGRMLSAWHVITVIYSLRLCHKHEKILDTSEQKSDKVSAVPGISAYRILNRLI